MPQGTHQCCECGRAPRLDGELELAKQVRHRAADEVIVDADELIDVHPAEAKGVGHRHGRAQAVGNGRYPVDLLRRVGAKAAVHGVGSLRLHSVDPAGRMEELACGGDSGDEPAAAYAHQERIQRRSLIEEFHSQSCRPECGVLTLEGILSLLGQYAVAQSWDGTRPLFLALLASAWNMIPADLSSLVTSLGAEFVARISAPLMAKYRIFTFRHECLCSIVPDRVVSLRMGSLAACSRFSPPCATAQTAIPSSFS